jgi:hypothetical protein
MPHGLHNFGATCYINTTLQLFNAIKPFREAIMKMKSPSALPFVLGLQEVFKGINSRTGVANDRLRELLTRKILPSITIGGRGFRQESHKDEKDSFFNLTDHEDIHEFMEGCFYMLDGIEDIKQVTKSFHCECTNIIREKANPANILNSESVSDLFLRLQINSNGFMQALQDWGVVGELTGANQYEKSDGLKFDAIKYERIVNPPSVFLVQLSRFSYDLSSGASVKIDDPMTIPPRFKLPSEIMERPKSVESKLIGGAIHRGTTKGGHYIAYIATEDGFLEFNDETVSHRSTQEGLKALREGAYIIAYGRQD